jgi:ATP-binding cassette subfamily F protein 3
MYHKEEIYEIGEGEKKEKTKADYQQRNQEKNRLKKIQKEIETIEEKISKLEQYRKEFEIRLSDPNFYSIPNHKIELQNYEKSKKDLEELNSKWEELSIEIEEK